MKNYNKKSFEQSLNSDPRIYTNAVSLMNSPTGSVSVV